MCASLLQNTNHLCFFLSFFVREVVFSRKEAGLKFRPLSCYFNLYPPHPSSPSPVNLSCCLAPLGKANREILIEGWLNVLVWSGDARGYDIGRLPELKGTINSFGSYPDRRPFEIPCKSSVEGESPRVSSRPAAERCKASLSNQTRITPQDTIAESS